MPTNRSNKARRALLAASCREANMIRNLTMISPPRPDMSFPNSQPTTPLRFLGGGCFRSAPNIIYMTDADFEPPDDDAEPSPAVVSTDTQAPLPQADLDDESSDHPQKKMKSFRSFLKKFRKFAAIFRTFKVPAILSRL